jgi:hypothetical protein
MLAHAHVRVFLVKRNVNVISPFKRVNTHENSPFTHTDACTHTYTYTYTYSLARTHCYILGSNGNVDNEYVVHGLGYRPNPKI